MSGKIWVYGVGAVVVAAGLTVALRSRVQPAVATAADSSPTGQARKQLWTCKMHPQVIEDHPGDCPICGMPLVPLNPTAKGKQPPTTQPSLSLDVHIDPSVVQNVGIRTAPVVRGPLTITIRAVGMLQAPETGLFDVTSRVNGYVQKLYADTNGMSVTKGEVLFDLYSPDLQVAAQELIAAEQNLKSLEPESPAALVKSTKNMVDSAQSKLRLWGLADQDIGTIAAGDTTPATIPIRAPASGFLADKAIVEGSSIQAGMKLMRIEDHSTLWLDLAVYEDQLSLVELNQDVHATVDAMPDHTYSAKVSFIFPHMDHLIRTALVRVVLDNPDHQLSPGMFAQAQILTRPVADAILVPRDAVIDTGTRQIAFLADPKSPGHFLPRIVQLGRIGDDDQAQVLQGLAPGDLVVTSGQFLLDVESSTQEAIAKFQPATPK